MTNRRSFFRHVLPPGRRLPVAVNICGGPTWNCALIDLSIGGMAIQLPAAVPARFLPGPWFTSFTLASGPPALDIPAELVRVTAQNPMVAGLRFLPVADPAANNQTEKRLSAFLLSEQIDELRQRRAQ